MLDNYPPGCAMDPHAPYNRSEQPEETHRVHEKLPVSEYRTRPRWVEVAPEDYGQAHDVTPEALLAACRAQEPSLTFQLQAVERD